MGYNLRPRRAAAARRAAPEPSSEEDASDLSDVIELEEEPESGSLSSASSAEPVAEPSPMILRRKPRRPTPVASSEEEVKPPPKPAPKKKSRLPPKLSPNREQALWKMVEAKIYQWAQLNNSYAAKFDAYLANEFEKAAGRTTFFLEYDLSKMSPQEMMKAMFRDVFKTRRKRSNWEICGMIAQLAEAGDDPTSPKFVVTINNWTTILNDPVVFSFIEESLQASCSPFLYVLRSDMVRQLVLNHYKIKTNLDACLETIVLVASQSCRIRGAFDDDWYRGLFYDIILEARSEAWPDSQCDDISPRMLKVPHKEAIDELIPCTPAAYLHSHNLHFIKGLPKSSQLRTATAPIKTLLQFKLHAYDI